LTERDIWATANLMLKRFGDDALIECAMRVDALNAEGDIQGAAIWRRILASTKVLSGRAASGTLH